MLLPPLCVFQVEHVFILTVGAITILVLWCVVGGRFVVACVLLVCVVGWGLVPKILGDKAKSLCLCAVCLCV